MQAFTPHSCRHDYLWQPDRSGILTRCHCGRTWRSIHPGNPAYAGWRRAGPLYRLIFRGRVRAFESAGSRSTW